MFYICEGHKVAFEKESSARAHYSFHHGGQPRPPLESISVDEVPEGYILRKPVPPSPRKLPAPPVQPQAPYIPPTTGDPEADRLGKILAAIGVPNPEVEIIINGFRNIPQIRNDPNYLSHWLETHISDRKLKPYIPMAVQEVFGGGESAPYLFPPQAAPGQFPRYAPGQFNQPVPQPTPWGYTPPAVNWPNWPYTTQQPQFLQPQFPLIPSPSQDDSQSKLAQHLGALETRIRELAESQAREREERLREERERANNARFEKLEVMLAGAIRHSQSEGEDKQVSQLEGLREELRGMRDEQSKERHETLQREISLLKQAVAQSRPDTVGRTTEDLVHELGPMALERVSEAGEGIREEIRGIRRQVFPAVREQAQKAAEPKTIEEIEAEAQLENELVELEEEEQPVEQPVEEPEPENPALRRMPKRGRKQE